MATVELGFVTIPAGGEIQITATAYLCSGIRVQSFTGNDAGYVGKASMNTTTGANVAMIIPPPTTEFPWPTETLRSPGGLNSLNASHYSIKGTAADKFLVTLLLD